MGRAGLEPATGGLKVDANVSRRLADPLELASMSQIGFGWVRAVWDPLVDPALTQAVALAGNDLVLGQKYLWKNASTSSFFSCN